MVCVWICLQVSATIRPAVLSCEPILLARLSVLYDATFETMVSVFHPEWLFDAEHVPHIPPFLAAPLPHRRAHYP